MSKLLVSALALSIPLSLAAAPVYASTYDQAARGASNYEQHIYSTPDRSVAPNDRLGLTTVRRYDHAGRGAANYQQRMDVATNPGRGSNVVAPQPGLKEPPVFSFAARPA